MTKLSWHLGTGNLTESFAQTEHGRYVVVPHATLTNLFRAGWEADDVLLGGAAWRLGAHRSRATAKAACARDHRLEALAREGR